MVRMTWDEMVFGYPDQWVAVKDAEMDGADIVSGEVVAHLPDREMREYRIKHFHSGLVFMRTTDGLINTGFIDTVHAADKRSDFIMWLISTATDKCQTIEEVRELHKQIRLYIDEFSTLPADNTEILHLMLLNSS